MGLQHYHYPEIYCFQVGRKYLLGVHGCRYHMSLNYRELDGHHLDHCHYHSKVGSGTVVNDIQKEGLQNERLLDIIVFVFHNLYILQR